ncbi:gliding motility-associated C-terminal domain-containing protein [Gilvibacter sediminis]|uniref:gliding motility-associated C-terminal domain-containing protein n=1 Tax=Gilvibacter sediminis TaxID=379071 RepID=UPI00234FB806|nr:gliding motility-associated C-terminal domain-containing protein [Gilvibacter sediminis]MDC7997114.1 gliding motility-associated C-terminal domain-containing protein [Gilvibacter sediminis]
MRSLYILLLSTALGFAQDGFHNFGNVKVHEEAAIGFHTDVINDGNFDDNPGFAGFYHQDRTLQVSGFNPVIFNTVEVDVLNDLSLQVNLGVAELLEFTNGRIFTPRDTPVISLDFGPDSVYLGESDDNHIDGYSTYTGDLDFVFPVGDDSKLRSLRVSPEEFTTTVYRAAYFFEDPNFPTTLSGNFDTDNFVPSLAVINVEEYWDLNASTETTATLSWDDESGADAIAAEVENLRVVGFDPSLEKWIDLGNTDVSGDLNNGTITSEPFRPDNYAALTLGSVQKADGSVLVYQALSPNGDGLNDFLVIEGVEGLPTNELVIFNRWGVEVFRKRNYDNSFDGISRGRTTLGNRGEPLPVGTYYYVFKIEGRKDLSGYIYITY